MSLIRRTRLAAAAVLLGTLGAGIGSAAEAEGQRRHAAHVHGVGKLEVVLEGATLHIAAHSPAANIVGFEHAPADDTARAAVAKAHRTLLEATRLFRLPERAGCRVDQASVRLPWPDHTRETADEVVLGLDIGMATVGRGVLMSGVIGAAATFGGPAMIDLLKDIFR